MSTKAEMTITDFATQHRLKTKHDKGDDTTIIPGKAGQLYEYSDEEFAVMYFLPATKPARPRVWNRMRELCAAAGMVLRQNGDSRGCPQLKSGESRASQAGYQAGGSVAQAADVGKAKGSR